MPQAYVQKQNFSNRQEENVAEYNFTGGLVLDAHESKLNPAQTPNVYNVLYNQTGSIKTRNGFTRYNLDTIGITADQSNSGASSGTLSITTQNTFVAQTFQPSGTVNVSQVDLWLSMANSGEEQYVYVELWSTSAGAPSALLTNGDGPIQLVSGTSETQYRFVFRHAAALTIGTTYAIVIRPYVATASSTTVREVKVHHRGTTYANGSSYTSADTGANWTADANKDVKFVVQRAGDTPVTGLIRYYNSTAVSQTLAKVGASLYRGNDVTGVMTAITMPSGINLAAANYSDYIVINDTMLLIDGANRIKKYRGSTNADYTTGTITVTNGSATITGSGTSWLTVTNAVVGEYIKLPDTKWYRITAIGSNTSITIERTYQGSTLSGQTYTISPWGEVMGKLNSSTAPSGLVVPTPNYIASYSDRVWVATGNSLYFSVLDTSVIEDHFNDWDTANNAGQINVPGGKGDIITGLYQLGNALYVFQRRAIWAIYGNSPANFELRNITNEIGLLNRRTIVEWNDVIMFLTDTGIVMFDGTNIKNISDGFVNSSIESWANSTSPCATLWDNKYMIGYTPGGDAHNAEALFYDMTRNAWGRFDHTHFNCFVSFIGGGDSGDLYFGSATTGSIYKWNVGGNDDGYKINTIYDTPSLGFGSGINDKAIKKFYIQQLTLGDWDMTVTQLTNVSETETTGSAINLTPGNSALWDEAQWDEDTWSTDGAIITSRVAEFQGIGKYFKFRLEQEGYNQGIEVLGMLATARMRRLN